MERKQIGREEIKEEEGTGRRSSEVGAKTDITMTLSVAEETFAFSVGNNWACSNRRGGENKCGNGERTRTEKGTTMPVEDLGTWPIITETGEEG